MDDRWRTSSQAYGAFWKAVPLEPKVVAPELETSQEAEAARRHARLERLLAAHGLAERPVAGDGNCQFRALADQLYGSEEHHDAIRAQVLEQLRTLPSRYQGFVPGRFESYLAHMARDGAWGDHVTLQAAADVLGVRIHVVSDFLEEAYIEVTPEQQKSSKVLKLCFWAEVHYNSLEELKR
ncbi:unnamed protein product [Effrenium voratum]|nr:unnamed protein product [Effrenium voratum]